MTLQSCTFLAILLAVGAYLRFSSLGNPSLTMDEAWMFWQSQGSYLNLILDSSGTPGHPGLFSILTRCVTAFGTSEWHLRLLPAVFGTLSIAPIYFACRSFCNTRGAMLAAAIAALHYMLVAHSRVLRSSSLALFIAILLMHSVQRCLLTREGRWAATSAVLLGLGILVHYAFAVVFLGLNITVCIVAWLSGKPGSTILYRWLPWQVLPTTCCLIIWFTGLAKVAQRGFGGSGSYLSYAYWQGGSPLSLVAFLSKNTLYLLEFSLPLAPVFAITIPLALLIKRPVGKDQAEKVFVLQTFILLALFMMSGITGLYPYSGHRQMIVIVPWIIGIACLAIQVIAARIGFLFELFIFVLTILVSLAVSLPLRNFPGSENSKPIVSRLLREYRQGDGIYVYPELNLAVRYYLRESDLTVEYQDSHRGDILPYLERIRGLLGTHERVWLLLGRCNKRECEEIEENLQRQGLRVLEISSSDDVYLHLLSS